MSFYAATLVELLIIEAFVFYIWLKVFFSTVAAKDGTLGSKKLLLTSLGLVCSSLAIVGIMGYRLYELGAYSRSVAWLVVALYMLLAFGGVLFMVSAALGNSTRLLKVFLAVSAAWTVFCIYYAQQ